MFNRKLKDRIERSEANYSRLTDRQRDDYWELKNDLQRLVDALGMTKEEIHSVKYIRKGGPEKGND